MTLNDVTQAAAARLKELWPGRRVFVDEVRQKADGCFFIGLTESSQRQELGARYRRSMSFQILYFRADRDAPAYQAWAEEMYGGFRALEVGGRLVRLKNQSTREDGEQRYYQFLFDVEVLFRETGTGEVMETLEQKETIQ